MFDLTEISGSFSTLAWNAVDCSAFSRVHYFVHVMRGISCDVPHLYFFIS